MSDVNRRVLVAGGSILAVLAALLAVGYFAIADRESGPSENASPSPRPTDPRVEIEQAYLNFYDVYAKAAVDLQPDLFDGVATGEALAALKAQIEAQRDKNQPVRIRVEHNYEIVYPVPEAGADTASIDDRYVNHSVRLDPATKEPIEPDPNTPTHDTYTLKKVDGKWKIAEIIEHR